MEFVSFEDTTAIYETIFFPQAFRRFCQDLDMNRAYLLYGQVGSEFGAVSLQVHRLVRLTPPADDQRMKVVIPAQVGIQKNVLDTQLRGCDGRTFT